MKAIIFIFSCSIGMCFCSPVTQKDEAANNSSHSGTGLVSFKTQVQPVLQNNCSPCHFPGGKLYEKLPFDKAETLFKHETAILKRIKRPGEVKLLKRFIEQNRITALNHHHE